MTTRTTKTRTEADTAEQALSLAKLLLEALEGLLPDIEAQIGVLQFCGEEECWMPLDRLASDARDAIRKAREFPSLKPARCDRRPTSARPAAESESQRDMSRSNETRAEHAAAICDEYGRLTHGKPDYDAPEDIAADLITDLMHMIKAHGADPHDKLITATINYKAEQAGEK